MKKIDCEIIMDLLPNYVEKLTSDYTNQAVEEHLEACAQCRKAYERMTEDMQPSSKEKIPEPVRILPFLQRMRSRAFYKGACLAAIICLILWGLTEIYQYIKAPVPVSAGQVSAESYLLEDGSVYVNIQAEEECPVTHGWSWYEEDETLVVSARTDRVPLDWLYGIESGLPFIRNDRDANQRAFLIPADEAAEKKIVFKGQDQERPAVLYDSDTELLPGTEELEQAVENSVIYNYMIMKE